MAARCLMPGSPRTSPAVAPLAFSAASLRTGSRGPEGDYHCAVLPMTAPQPLTILHVDMDAF
ncbi:MAG: hypothetical protein VXW31_01970, partial [Planctomycetota bacterium]|nr:hypothetical protein [Planctomycetota bacterium]